MNLKAFLEVVSLVNPRVLGLKILISIFIALSAFAFGLLAVSGSPLLISLGVGLFAGALLLTTPKYIVYLLLLIGLVFPALGGSALSKLNWSLSLLGLLLLLPVSLGIVGSKKSEVPVFIWIAIAFLVYSLAVTILSWASFTELLGGFKRYFQVYGLLLALAFLPFAKQDFLQWKKLLLVVGLLQFPFALYELLFLVPARGGLSLASYTSDVIAGTFGANLEGGSPGGVMVVFLIVNFIFVLSRWRGGLINAKGALLLCTFLLLPLGMGETKIVVLMLPIALFVLIRHSIIQDPIKNIPAIFAIILLTSIFICSYVYLIMGVELSSFFESLIESQSEFAGYGSNSLNRLTALDFWWSNQGMHDPVGFLFGNGLGSSYLGLGSGHIGMQYIGYGINLTALSTLLWDVGLIGCVLFFAIFIGAWRSAGKIFKESDDACFKADALAIQATISIFLVSISYSADIISQISLEIIYSFVLGYLAYLHKVHYRRRSLLSS